LLSRVLASTKRELKAISWSCVVAYNKVQFQEGLSEPEFDRLYGTEEQCRAVVIAARWPNGFVCPECGRQQHSIIHRHPTGRSSQLFAEHLYQPQTAGS
jgi:predicted RNA-binding Zn-ribbon protein involved in translation (DUF1610 family)